VRPSPNGRNGLIDGVSRREIDGLVVDETQTKIGRDFFEVFYAAWERPAGAMNYTVRIQEQPSPSLGTRVVVFLDDEVLFQLQLQPRYEVVEELAQQAALYTAREVETRRPAPSPAAAGDPPG
jgi:curli production assembly/transport component CsgE